MRGGRRGSVLGAAAFTALDELDVLALVVALLGEVEARRVDARRATRRAAYGTPLPVKGEHSEELSKSEGGGLGLSLGEEAWIGDFEIGHTARAIGVDLFEELLGRLGESEVFGEAVEFEGIQRAVTSMRARPRLLSLGQAGRGDGGGIVPKEELLESHAARALRDPVRPQQKVVERADGRISLVG